MEDGSERYIKPKYQIGDILWVRETWQSLHNMLEEGVASCVVDRTFYKADYQPGDLPLKEIWELPYWNWRPSIFMPRAAARLFLEVKSVRVERIQDIGQNDAWLEGVDSETVWDSETCGHSDYIIPFSRLWDTLNAKRGYSWESNPWVWVIEFERV